MKMSPLFSLSSGLFLLLFVSPLQSDPQQTLWRNYQLPRSTHHRSQPLLEEEIFPDHYAAPRIQRSESHATHYVPQALPIYESSQFRSDASRYPVKVPETYQQQAGYYDYETYGLNNEEKEVDDTEISSREKGIVENMKALDRLLSEDSERDEMVDNNIYSLDEKIMSEETKRVARQIRKERPGFFWTLARVTFETINDTRSAFQQISDMINNNIAPDSATQGSMPRGSLTATAASASSKNTSFTNETETVTTGPTSTTPAPFVLTRSSLQSLIRRNVLGLVKLFNLEWNEALNQSEINVRQFQKDLGKQVGTYLQDNPNAYR